MFEKRRQKRQHANELRGKAVTVAEFARIAARQEAVDRQTWRGLEREEFDQRWAAVREETLVSLIDLSQGDADLVEKAIEFAYEGVYTFSGSRLRSDPSPEHVVAVDMLNSALERISPRGR